MQDLTINSSAVQSATSTGLDIKPGTSLSDLAALVEQVDKMESDSKEFINTVSAWYRGDIFNALPEGRKKGDPTKEEQCETIGLTYKTVQDWGTAAKTFSLPERSGTLSFTHHLYLARQAALNKDQRASLLKQAEENQWSTRTLDKEIKTILGKGGGETRGRPAQAEAALPGIDETVKAQFEETLGELPNLPKSVQQKVTKGIKKMYNTFKRDFEKQVREEVVKGTAKQREVFTEKEKQADKKLDSAIKIQAGARAFMTQDEFRFIRSLVHPDRAPKELLKKFTKATEIMNRIGERAGW